MSSDVRYSVEVEYLSKGGFTQPAAQIKNLTHETEKWTKSLASGVGNFASGFTSAVNSIGRELASIGSMATLAIGTGLAAGLGEALKTAFEFNEQIENVQLSLAAISNANGETNGLAEGFRLAGEVIKQMRVDAAALPGEFKDLEGIMQSIFSSGSQLGVGMFGMEKIASKTMMAASILGVNQATAGSELSMMLEGSASHKMPLFRKLGLNMSSHQLNAMDPKERLNLVYNRLEKLATPEAIKRASETWTGTKTTAIDRLKGAAGAVGMPLFEAVKAEIQKFNKMDPDKFVNFGMKVGDALVNAFHFAVDGIKHWYPIVATFAKNMYNSLHNVWNSLSPIIKNVFGKVEAFMQNPKALDKIIHAAEIFAGLSIGGSLVSGGMGMLSGAAGLGGGGAAGLAVSFEAISVAAGPVAIVIAGMLVGFQGMWDAITETDNYFHEFAMGDLAMMRDSFKDLTTTTGHFGKTIKPLVDLFGVAWLTSINLGLYSLDGFVKALDVSSSYMKTWAELLINWIKEKLHISDTPAAKVGWEKDDHSDRTEYVTKRAVKEFEALRGPNGEQIKDPPKNNTYIGHVEIKVNSNEDPNRIAKRVTDIIKDLKNHPKVALAAGNPVYPR